MKTSMRSRRLATAGATIALAITALGAAAFDFSLGPARLPAEQQVATRRKAQADAASNLRMALDAVNAEPRNPAWADGQESLLRSTYGADPTLAKATLTTVDCRTTHCALALSTSVAAPTDAQDQYAAINQWIATSQPCGYTISGPPGLGQNAAGVSIVVNCNDQ